MKNKQLCLFNSNMDNQIVLHDPIDIDFVELLLRKGFDVNHKDYECRTLLHRASIKGRFDVAELLIRNNADVNCTNISNNTPLHLASANGHLNIVKLLLKHDANVNCLNNYSGTPLHNSSSMGHIDIVDVLIRNGAIVNRVDMFNHTPLTISSSKGHTNIVELLLINGADVNISASQLGIFSEDKLLQQWKNKQHPLQIASNIIRTDFPSYVNCYVPEIVELTCEFLHLPVKTNKQVYIAE